MLVEEAVSIEDTATQLDVGLGGPFCTNWGPVTAEETMVVSHCTMESKVCEENSLLHEERRERLARDSPAVRRLLYMMPAAPYCGSAPSKVVL